VKTQSLRITVGVYEPDAVHIAIVADTYVAGVMANSELVTIRWGTTEDAERLVMQALDQVLRDAELNALEKRRAGGTQSVPPARP
jgi:hypothetical protein